MLKNSATEKIKKYYDQIASYRDDWKKRNYYYHQQIEHLCKFLIPKKKKILDIGCSTGDLLASLKPHQGVGLDISRDTIKIAKKKHPELKFIVGDAQNLNINEKFDYVVMSDVIGSFEDVQRAFDQLQKVADEKTRIIITSYNYLWEPILNLAEKLGLKMPLPLQNWLTTKDIENLLFLADFEVIKKGGYLLLPVNIPIISEIFNRYLAQLPILKSLTLVSYYIVRKKPNIYSNKEYSVSVIIPARNEKGNIEDAIIRTPKLGIATELIFIEKGSTDGTYEEIQRVAEKYKDKREIRYIKGNIDTKGSKVRQGFEMAKGDILMILDSDLTVIPEDLPKFYNTLRTGKAEFVMGTRLVYPMEKEAMRFLNMIGNKFFSLAFSWLLDQDIKDTLCGTKVLFRSDYDEIVRNRSYFGDFDPFGDFDLIFGAAKNNLKIVEIPIRYHARTYGQTNISRFRHGWLLLQMTVFAAKKLKFI